MIFLVFSIMIGVCMMHTCGNVILQLKSECVGLQLKPFDESPSQRMENTCPKKIKFHPRIANHMMDSCVHSPEHRTSTTRNKAEDDTEVRCEISENFVTN